MFEGQPKGLYALALANTGERFGFYTMLAIFTLFIQAKFGFSEGTTSTIYGLFMALVYFLPLLGGLIADQEWGYGKSVTIGIIVMFFGYLLLAIPVASTAGLVTMLLALVLICFGTGLFKGNLQVMVGNLYEESKYKNKRDTGFSLFYMAINVGALFAPAAATKITNMVLAHYNFTYDGQIPALAHQYLDKTITEVNQATLIGLQEAQGFVGSLDDFCRAYIEHLSQAYNLGFGLACISLIFSIAIYFGFRKSFKHADYNSKQAKANNNVVEEEISPAETRQRITALILVFAVVLFFWMAFQQNGLTMTFFARDYTQHSVSGVESMLFNVWNLVLFIVFIYAAFSIFQSKKAMGKIISGIICVAIIVAFVVIYSFTGSEDMPILPQIFQQFNPCFVVALTPVSIALFGWLAKKGKEPSAPRKIGLGMIVAAIGFTVLAFGSFGLPTPNELAAGESVSLVSPNWLISTYLILTFGELLLSPIGISFVSKVAPPKYKGAMMGGWFAATAIGNYMVAIIGYLWGGLPLWMVWSILIVLCLLSAGFIFSIMKQLEKVS